MTEMLKKTVTVRVKNPATGMNYNPIRHTEKVVEVFDTDSGQCTDQVMARRERQAKEKAARMIAWRKLSPMEQLAELDLRLGTDVGAGKQRAKIKAKLAKLLRDAANVPEKNKMKQQPKKQGPFKNNKKRHHHN